MEKLKQWVAVTVLAVLGIGALSWFLLISPKKSEASDLRTEAEAQTAATQVLRNDIKVLQEQAKNLPKERGKLSAVAAKLPSDPSMPTLIRALSTAADASGLKFVSLTPSAPVAATATTSSTPVASGTAETPVASTPVAAATGLTTIPVSIQVFGGFYQVQSFIKELENLPRALRVTSLNVEPGKDPGVLASAKTDSTDGRHLLTVITGEVYMSSLSSATSASPVAAGAAGTSS